MLEQYTGEMSLSGTCSILANVPKSAEKLIRSYPAPALARPFIVVNCGLLCFDDTEGNETHTTTAAAAAAAFEPSAHRRRAYSLRGVGPVVGRQLRWRWWSLGEIPIMYVV